MKSMLLQIQNWDQTVQADLVDLDHNVLADLIDFEYNTQADAF